MQKGVYAGLLTEIDREHYSFCYDMDYYNNPELPAISLVMPKKQQEYTSPSLFPVFFNMTSEGDNRIIQARSLQIDEDDDFGILLATATQIRLVLYRLKKCDYGKYHTHLSFAFEYNQWGKWIFDKSLEATFQWKKSIFMKSEPEYFSGGLAVTGRTFYHFGLRIGLPERLVNACIEKFCKINEVTDKLIDNSFLSE